MASSLATAKNLGFCIVNFSNLVVPAITLLHCYNKTYETGKQPSCAVKNCTKAIPTYFHQGTIKFST